MNRAVIMLAAMFGDLPSSKAKRERHGVDDPELVNEAMRKAFEAKSYKERRKWECAVSKMLDKSWKVTPTAKQPD